MSALDRLLEAAAEARGAAMRQATDRPSQRRCAETAGSPPVARIRSPRMELRAAGDSGSGLLTFTGYASVYAAAYEMWDMWGPYTEQVSPGAGAQSLAQEDLDVPLVVAHDSLRRIARTTNGSLQLSEDPDPDVAPDGGLLVMANQLDPSDPDVAYIVPKMESGLIDEMSFRFLIESGSWSTDWTEFHIDRYEINRGDVSIVGYGANPWTAGAGLRSAPSLDRMSESDLVKLENDLHGERKRRGLDAPAAASMTLTELERIDRSTLLAPVAL